MKWIIAIVVIALSGCASLDENWNGRWSQYNTVKPWMTLPAHINNIHCR